MKGLSDITVKKFDLLIVGVGGQGVIMASNIISEVALAAGYDVKKTDTLGMAQRGGSVLSHVRVGREVHSPLIKTGEVDIMVAFEKLEAVRWAHYLKSEATAIVNNYALPPLSVNQGNEPYPDDESLVAAMKAHAGRVFFIDGSAQAEEIGNVRALNTVLLGCLSLFLPLKISVWQDIISQHVPPKVQKLNASAFNRGRREMRRVCFA